MWRGLTIAIALLAAVFHQTIYFAHIKVGGLGRAPDPLNNERCHKIEGLEACEKLIVHAPSGLVYLACSSIQARMDYLPYIDRLNAHVPSVDFIAIYDPSSPSSAFRKLEQEGFPDQRGLYVHGMEVVPSRKDPNILFVYLVNHRPPLRGEAGANSVIEIFKTTVGSTTLIHLKTVDNPNVIVTPNDVSGSPDGDSFYFTNDHGIKFGKLKYWEKALTLPLSSVGYCHVEHGCKNAVKNVVSVNGIVRRGENDIFVVSCAKGSVNRYISRADGTLAFRERIYVAFPNVHKIFERVLKNIPIEIPAAVYKISFPGIESATKSAYRVERIFEDDGRIAEGRITTSAYDNGLKRLYLTGAMTPRVLSCEL